MVDPLSVLGERYRLESLLGQGGMGQVWRAWDKTLSRPVAIKVLHDAGGGSTAFRRRLRVEARLAAGLSHPGLAGVFDYADGLGDAPPFVVMELVDGPALSTLLATDGPRSPAQVADMLGQVARALSAVHAAGIVHRDVKLSNLLLGPAGQLKLTDFGIAHAFDAATLTATGGRVGSPPYMSPEQVGSGTVGPASDVYSLGVAGYELLTGRRPFIGEPIAVALAHREQAPPPLPAAVPTPLAALIMSMLAKDPAARPTTTQVSERAGGRAAPVTMAIPVASAEVPTQAIRVTGLTDTAGAGEGRRSRRAVLAASALTIVAALGILLAVVVARSGQDAPSAAPTAGTHSGGQSERQAPPTNRSDPAQSTLAPAVARPRTVSPTADGRSATSGADPTPTVSATPTNPNVHRQAWKRYHRKARARTRQPR